MSSLHLERQWAALKYGLVFRKPRFLGRMGRFYLSSFVGRGPQPLRYVDFAVDYRCNLKCAHCFATALESAEARPRLEVEDYRRIARECLDLGAIHLSLQGGEATLHPQLEELIRAMSPERCLFSITTNGTTLDEARVRKLRAWGVDQLNVSIDSLVPEEHDTFRGVPGSLARTLSGIRTARANGLRVQVNTTVAKFNLFTPGFREVVDFCQQERMILNLVLATPTGRWDANDAATLSEEDMRYVRALVWSSPWVRQDMDSIQLGRGCPAMKEAMYITPYGDVLSCPFIHVSFGNLHEESLADIRRKALEYHFLGTHAQRCLAAEEPKFLGTYMAKLYGRRDLPAPSGEVFGTPAEAAARYPLPRATVTPGEDLAPLVAEWRARTEAVGRESISKSI